MHTGWYIDLGMFPLLVCFPVTAVDVVMLLLLLLQGWCRAAAWRVAGCCAADYAGGAGGAARVQAGTGSLHGAG
jgi:hypothetical protein